MKITKRLSAVILSVVLLLTLVTLPVAAEEAVQQDIKGDVNGDTVVNSSDALLVLKHAVKKSELTITAAVIQGDLEGAKPVSN